MLIIRVCPSRFSLPFSHLGNITDIIAECMSQKPDTQVKHVYKDSLIWVTFSLGIGFGQNLAYNNVVYSMNHLY